MEHEIDNEVYWIAGGAASSAVALRVCRTCGVLVADDFVDAHRAYFAGVKGQAQVFTPGMVEKRLGVGPGTDNELPPNPDVEAATRQWVDKLVVVKLNGEPQYLGQVRALLVDQFSTVVGLQVVPETGHESDPAGDAYVVNFETPGLTVELR